MVAEVLVKEKLYTVEEYFKLEEMASGKSEFRNGKIITMSGGSYNHSKIVLNIAIILASLVDEDTFDVVSSDHQIQIPEYNHFVYSDTCVIKGEPKFYKGGNQGILNPILIFEVSSDSTARYDRYTKFQKYKSLPSFEEYVLVEQEVPIVEVYSKNGDVWESTTYIGLDKTIKLQSIGTELKMIDIYKKVKGLLNPQTMLEL